MVIVNKKLSDIFKCTMCGKCCCGYGGTYISKKDAKKIALFLNTKYKNFISLYTQLSGKKNVIVQKKNGYCIFFSKNNICLIHPVKPSMCKNWPIIKSIVIDITNWKIMARMCPGMKINEDNNYILNYINFYLKK